MRRDRKLGWLAVAHDSLSVEPQSADAYVFGSETGDLLTRRRVCALWLATCQRAKVTDLHLHDLRGEAGSQLLEAGVPIHEVRDALGHSSTTMTSTYLGMRRQSLKRAYRQP